MNHYFEPGDGAWEAREITVRLAGREAVVETGPGMFSPEHIDTGTRILLETVPDPVGTVLDIGCGWGPIALTAGALNPGGVVWAIDVNHRGLELTRRNAERLGLTNIHVGQPDDVPGNVKFNMIWTNPPIRVGKAELHDILDKWIPRLIPGGVAYLVVAKKLGAESLMKWLAERWPDATVTKPEIAKGFWVIEFASAA